MTYWNLGTEVYVADPRPLPATYEEFQRGVIHATLALRAGRPIEATAVGRHVRTDDSVTVSGRVINAKQSYIYPISTDIPGQNALVLETQDGNHLSLGGNGAFVEDIEVAELTLREMSP
jgi:hypothetical protein